ncbi:hypothetical protein M9H77_22499 [Catharanthus roseus]|uniref:Uncharacterized protein n=1 Tax=Catharanthus roseus TaxID=4058 RepID=A0ACC0AR15_CATRO|nr:hypothetical protein M9H77_22499 [Catharanthus roseus]
MEEAPTHHEHRSGLIWSGDHETCFTDLQCRHFGRNLFQCYSTALHRFTDDDLILHARGFIFLLLGGRMLPDFSGNLVHVCYLSLLEDIDAIRTYRWALGCTIDRGSLSLSTDLSVVAYTCIAASADYRYSGRPFCFPWRYMVHIL